MEATRKQNKIKQRSIKLEDFNFISNRGTKSLKFVKLVRMSTKAYVSV